jgi:hypothetical protein
VDRQEEIGHKVAAALVGTFLGILLLRVGRADCLQYGEDRRRGKRLFARLAGGNDFVS